MLRLVPAGLILVLVIAGIVLAEDTRGTITKVDGDSITVKTGGGFGKDAAKAEDKTFKLAKDVKISKLGNKDMEDTKLTLEELKIATKVTNVFVTVTHEGDTVSEIKTGFRFGGKGGFGKDKTDKTDKTDKK
jgi:hypothetical protein